MTRNERRGQAALTGIDKLVPPQQVFIGGEAKRLYKLEEKRSEAIKACATEWAKVVGVAESMFWQQSLPQAIFDTLENYGDGCSIIAAEAFLKQLGWKVERPEKKI